MSVTRCAGFGAARLYAGGRRSLAIGIGFNTALFTLVDALLFRPLPVDGPIAWSTSSPRRRRRSYATSSYPDFLDFKAQNQVFSDMLAYSPSIAAVKLTDRSRLAMGETVTGNYFQLLGVRRPPDARCCPTTTGRAPRAVVISYRLWDREFGRAVRVGQSIRIHGQPTPSSASRRSCSLAWCR